MKINRNNYKISKYNFETKETEYFNDIKEAAASVQSNQEPWKVELTIFYAIVTKKKAFKCGWKKIFDKK